MCRQLLTVMHTIVRPTPGVLTTCRAPARRIDEDYVFGVDGVENIEYLYDAAYFCSDPTAILLRN